jgi:selenocysteine-specific elongation factor
VLESVNDPVAQRGAHLLHVGSGEHAVRIRVLGASSVRPGQQGLVRVFLPVALPLVPGDRYVLRDAGRGRTVGGGEVLDVAPVLPPRSARPDRSVERVVAERGWIHVDDLERLTGVRRPADVGRWAIAPAVLDAAREELRAAVEEAGPLGLDLTRLDGRHRALLALDEEVTVSGGRARLQGRDEPLEGHPYLHALEQAPFHPPLPEEAGTPRAEVRELVRRGLVVERDEVFFAASAVDEAARVVSGLLRRGGDAGVTVAEVRDALGSTRRYVVPLLGALDGRGVTRRRGDRRIPGPRLPPPGS